MGILNFLKSNNDKQKSIRIKTEIGDKFVNVNLNQTYVFDYPNNLFQSDYF